jgi:uncharacterized protein YcbK (DUF882 family)
MVKRYSLKKDGQTLLSPSFRVAEFACKDGSDEILICSELVRMLQLIRDHLGAPVTIMSGYRTPSWNARVGGATKSYHTRGQASDIQTPAQTPAKLYAQLDAGRVAGIDPALIGLGRYPTFVHIDSRGFRGRW